MSLMISHYAGMTEEDLDAVVTWLQGLPPFENDVPAPEWDDAYKPVLEALDKEQRAAMAAAAAPVEAPAETPAEDAAPAEGSDADAPAEDAAPAEEAPPAEEA